MANFARPRSIVVSAILSAVLVFSSSASAEVLAYKQLQSMFERGNGWHLVFVEWLANTGSAEESNVQITADLTPFGVTPEINIISSEVLIQKEGGTLGTGAAQINASFNGVSDRGLLLSGATLGAGDILRVTYSVDVALSAGPIALQSVASPGGDLSANGEKNIGSPLDIDSETLISLPQTLGTPPNACLGNQIESTFNLVKNGDFSTVHGLKPGGEQPLNISSSAGQLLATSFFSDAPYAGDDAFAADNNDIGAFTVDFENGVSIHQSNVGTGITLFSGSTFQHGFPGDFNRGVASTDNYLFYNGNRSNLSVDVWKQQISGLRKDTQYHFVAYTSNTSWPGLTNLNLVEPSIQLLATNAQGGNLSPFIVPQETAAERDTWRPVSTIITPIGVDPVELSINDGNINSVFGDQLAIAQIGLFQCLDAVGDTDNDGLSNVDEITLNTNPDGSDSDGDGADDLVEVGSVSSPLDSDGDGIIDALESSILDSDGDGTPDEDDSTNDGSTGDADGDGVSNGDEIAAGANPNNSDSDGDGKLDGLEFGKDSDNDGKPDIIESSIADEDGDSLADEIDNFDNRPKGSGGGGAAGFTIVLLPAIAALRRRKYQVTE